MSFSDLEKQYFDVCVSKRKNESVIQLTEVGWFSIIETILEEARKHNAKISLIKEKWAGLRIYYDGGDDIFEGMCSFGKSLAGKICDQCGKPGQRREGGGWYVTGCSNCYPGYKICKPN
ncbi:MAG: hypothetical protein MUO21_02475 [Nitrososphaeraceae archaeon]|nr:hypothetical protein [Nitrososphaeraceae archaeon]